MLKLTRNPGEAIMIGDDIVVRVMEIRPGQVSIGIDAPKHIEVHREEVYKRIQAERSGK